MSERKNAEDGDNEPTNLGQLKRQAQTVEPNTRWKQLRNRPWLSRIFQIS